MNRKAIKAFFICVLIGIGVIVQARITDGQMLYVSPNAISEYQAMIESEKQAVNTLGQQREDAKKLLAEYDKDMSDPDNHIIIKNIENEFKKYQMFVGAVDVAGPGVVITVDDGTRDLYAGEDINNLLVHDADILMIINELKRCGAEAISVNSQRVCQTTEISCSGYTIRINGQTYARPFIIKAIGDGKKMVSAFLGPEGYGTSLKQWGVQFSIELDDEIVVEALENQENVKYMKQLKGE